MPATRGLHPNSMSRDFEGIFMTDWSVNTDALRRVTTELNITRQYAKFADLYAGVKALQTKAEGADVARFAVQPGYDVTITPDTYAAGFVITQEMIEDDQVDQVDQYPELLAGLVSNTFNVKGWYCFNEAFSSTNQALPNAGALIATTQALASGESGGSNRLAVDADLTETTLEGLIELLMDTVNEDGVYIPDSPTTLVTSNAVWATSRQLIRSVTTTEQGTGESGNAINAISEAYNLTHVASPHISDGDATYLLGGTSPVVFGNRLEPEFDSGMDPNNKNYYFDVRTRFMFKPVTWRGIVGTDGA